MDYRKNFFTTVAIFLNLVILVASAYATEEIPLGVSETKSIQVEGTRNNKWTFEQWLREKIQEDMEQHKNQTMSPYTFGQEVGTWIGKFHATCLSKSQNYISEDILALFHSQGALEVQTMIDGYWTTYELAFNQEKRKIEFDELQQSYKNRINHGYVDPVGGQMESGDHLLSVEIESGIIYERIGYDIESKDVDYSLLKGYGHALSRGYQIRLQHKLPLTSGQVRLRFKGKVFPNQTLAVIRAGSVHLFDAQTDDQGFYITAPLKDINSSDIYFMIERGIHNGYTDVEQSFAKEEIAYLSSANVLKGTGDGYFHPHDPISRLEFVTILGRVQQWPETYTQPLPFHDKDMIVYSQAFVSYAVQNGWIKGYEDGSFQANRSISYQEVEWLLERLAQRDVSMISIARMWQQDKLYTSDALNSLQLGIKRDEMASIIFHLRNGTLP